MGSTQSMASLEWRNLNAALDEIRKFDKGKLEIANIGGASIGRIALEPGWRWSTSIKPIAKIESCEVHHTGYIISGRLRVRE
ncbi:MAG TPA: hypothetical protein VF172_11485 [Nitrososphaera sp.]